MFQKSSVTGKDYIDKVLFGLADEAIISPGWRTNGPLEGDNGLWSVEEDYIDSKGRERKIRMGDYDKRLDLIEKVESNELTLEKALSISGFSGTIIPVYVDPAIIDITRKETPIVELIPRVANRGKSADFNRITALGSTGFQTEDAALSEVNDTIGRKSATIFFQYAVGRVTGPVQAASAEYIDGMNLEVLNKTKQLRYIEEQAFLVGNGTAANTRWSDGSAAVPWNSAAYSGLSLQQEGTSVAAGENVWGTSNNIVDVANGNLALSHIRSGIQQAEQAGGRPKLIITDTVSVRIVKGLMNEFQRLNDTTNFAWGITAITIDGIPVIPSKLMPRTTRQRKILIIDTDVIEARVLQDIVFERLAKTNDSDKFYLKVYETIINKAPEFSAQVIDYA